VSQVAVAVVDNLIVVTHQVVVVLVVIFTLHLNQLAHLQLQ
jgi:hypothetical protein